MGFPSDLDLANGIENGNIQDCGFDCGHIKIANEIEGPSKHVIAGKSVQRKSKMPRESSRMSIPPSILRRYGEVTIGVDYFYINGNCFLIIISKHIKFYQCLCVKDTSSETFLQTVTKLSPIYKVRGFKIKTIHADRQFEPCEAALKDMGMTLDFCDAGGHIPFVEIGIQFIKTRVRCIRSMIPPKVRRIP